MVLISEIFKRITLLFAFKAVNATQASRQNTLPLAIESLVFLTIGVVKAGMSFTLSIDGWTAGYHGVRCYNDAVFENAEFDCLSNGMLRLIAVAELEGELVQVLLTLFEVEHEADFYLRAGDHLSNHRLS